MDDQQRDQLVKVVAAGAGAYAAYELLYLPWAMRRNLQRITDAAALANVKAGMGIEEAAQQAIAGACVAGAAAYKVPPTVSASICQGVGILAEKGLKVAAKGAIVAGKVIGKGAVVVGKDIGKGVKAAVYTAPKAVGKAVARGAVAVAYKAPKAAIKSVAKSISHGFGLWGIDELKSRRLARAFDRGPDGNPFATHQAAGQRPAQRKPRSLGGLAGGAAARRPAAGRARPSSARAGVEFYTRHL